MLECKSKRKENRIINREDGANNKEVGVSNKEAGVNSKEEMEDGVNSNKEDGVNSNKEVGDSNSKEDGDNNNNKEVGDNNKEDGDNSKEDGDNKEEMAGVNNKEEMVVGEDNKVEAKMDLGVEWASFKTRVHGETISKELNGLKK